MARPGGTEHSSARIEAALRAGALVRGSDALRSVVDPQGSGVREVRDVG